MSKQTYTLEEILTLTNEELTGNWAKLASLIRAFEGGEWAAARKKSGELLKQGNAVAYIEEVRAAVSGGSDTSPLNTNGQKRGKPKGILKNMPAVVKLLEQNYKRLLKVAPDLDKRLDNSDFFAGDEVYGKSQQTGYMDFNLELIHQDDTGHYVAISHYYIQNGDMVPDPDMVLLVDTKNEQVIPLSFQNALTYKTVFDDIYDRKMISTRELKGQNSFLSTWLKNLFNQGHKIRWQKSYNTGMEKGDSSIEKQTPPKVQKDAAPVLVTAVSEEDPSQTAPSNTDEKEIQEIVKYWRKLAAFIVDEEHISQEKAEKKALELKESGEAWQYVGDAMKKREKQSQNELFRANYHAVLALIPELYEYHTNEDMQGILSVSGDWLPYEILWSKPVSATTNSIAIFENPEKPKGRLGFIVLAINRINKRVWLMKAENGFFKLPEYDVSLLTEKELENEDRSQLMAVNKRLGRWLELMIGKKYKVKWIHTTFEEETEPVVEEAIEEQVEIKLPQTEEEEEIPDFAPGQVQLTKAHIKAGLTQREIDWINKHKQGLVITPRNRPVINNTVSLEGDLSKKAMRPGFRISRTGKLYYEGRSNRSDLTDFGI